MELLVTDPTLSDLNRSHKIVENLPPPASDFIKHLGSQALPLAYLQLLDSAYGTVEDGGELFARFLSTLQDAGENPSNYLHRLQVMLSTALRRGGVSADEFDRHLLKQFCRGCWDDALIADLQLEQKLKQPPAYAKLLLQLRTEKDKHANKVMRMKKHLGASKQPPGGPKLRVWSQLQSARTCSEEKATAETDQLKKQIAELQAQVAQLATGNKSKSETPLNTKKKVTPKPKPDPQPSLPPHASENRPPNKPRPWYCFRCGEDGHIAPKCTNDANPTLVATKRKRMQEQQQQWESENHPTDPPHLN